MPKARKLSAGERKAIRAVLEREREELAQQLAEIEEEYATSQRDSVGEGGYDEDFADAGSATFEREKELSIHNNVVDLLRKAERAVAKLDDGSYGICESCGRPIESKRLKALPSALLCLACKKREELR